MHPWPHCSSSSRSMGKTEECKPLANSKLNYGVIAKFPEDRCIKRFDNLIQTCAARVRYAVKPLPDVIAGAHALWGPTLIWRTLSLWKRAGLRLLLLELRAQ